MRLLAYNFGEDLMMHDFVLLDGTYEQNSRVRDLLEEEETSSDEIDIEEGEWFKVTFGWDVYLDHSEDPIEIKSKLKSLLKDRWDNCKDNFITLDDLKGFEIDEFVDVYKSDYKSLDDLVEHTYKIIFEEQTIDGPSECEVKLIQFHEDDYKSAEEFLEIYDRGEFVRPQDED